MSDSLSIVPRGRPRTDLSDDERYAIWEKYVSGLDPVAIVALDPSVSQDAIEGVIEFFLEEQEIDPVVEKTRICRRNDLLVQGHSQLLEDRMSRHDQIEKAIDRIEKVENFERNPDLLRAWRVLMQSGREEALSICKITKEIRGTGEVTARVLNLKKLRMNPQH